MYEKVNQKVNLRWRMTPAHPDIVILKNRIFRENPSKKMNVICYKAA